MIKTILISCVSGAVIICLACITELPGFVRYLLIPVGSFIIISGIILAILKDIKTKIYSCNKCGHRFIPSVESFFKGNRCPECNSSCKYLKRDIKI